MDGMLSKDEIEALLAQARNLGSVSGGTPSTEASEAKGYDFRRPEKFSREQIRVLERVFEKLARLLSTSLSAYIRTNVTVKLDSVTPLSYQDYIASLAQTTLINVVELAPLAGQAALEINPPVVFSMYEQMMGGQAQRESPSRPLTEVELLVFRRVVERILSCVVETWQAMITLRPSLLRMEQDPQFAQVAATNAPVIVISLGVALGETAGAMTLCLADTMLEGMLELLSAGAMDNTGEGPAAEQAKVVQALVDVALPVIAVLGRSALTVDQIRELRPGDLVRLSTAAGDDVQVQVGDQMLFRARVVQVRRRLAVEIGGAIDAPHVSEPHGGELPGRE